MECNKEEALRAKAIAENKMQSKDFMGARKFVVKAQQLHPEVENISRLLSVCDVHCAAESKMFGNEMDWYGILQVDQTADDTTIKKQYRKFALLLHPDKNQSAGAEAAFKLVGEAQRVLLDKQKRSFHDMKRGTSYKPGIPHKPPQQASSNVGAVRQTRPQNNFPSNPNSHVRASNAQHQGQMPQAQSANARETFWTLCPHCFVRYQYFKEFLGMTLRCQSCKNSYTALDMRASRSDVTKPVSSQQQAPWKPIHVGQEIKKPSSNAGFQAGQKGPSKSHMNGGEGSKLRRSNSQKRKKRFESSESDESDSTSLDSEEVEIHEAGNATGSQHFDSDGDRQTRRSNRNKRHVSYDENASGDEQISAPSKKNKVNGSTEEKVDGSNASGSAFGEESKKKESSVDDLNENVASSTEKRSAAHDGFDSSIDPTPDLTPEPTFYECPDPDFCDFDKSREESCFEVGQLWAAYDTVDAMPRFYAKIKKIYASGFKLQITWLEANPNDEVEIEWTNSDLPYSCGKFKLGQTEITEDRLMFSHVVNGFKSIGRNSFMIYPRVGETWAIFKNWDLQWSWTTEKERTFEYDFVEILSDYDKVVGIRVAPLVKLKGYASLFCRKKVSEIHIQPSEFLRFSHMVPSYTTTGNEEKKVLKGYIELDPASTTLNIEEIDPPQLDTNNRVNGLSNTAEENGTVNVAGNSATPYSENKGSRVKHKNGIK
ncbi:uncharacterized protein LOC141619183 [Silene latifolia]|uniref:uncharacterized protein LOC141619183 n=1 Tax=Silene latifolia TaxID=37657 RepID=UPI003D7796A6